MTADVAEGLLDVQASSAWLPAVAAAAAVARPLWPRCSRRARTAARLAQRAWPAALLALEVILGVETSGPFRGSLPIESG